MTQSSFSAQIDAWVLATKARQEAVLKESAQRVIAAMQRPVGVGGNMPVDTGFLRASLQASTSGPLPIRDGARPEADATYATPGTGLPSQVHAVISNAEIGDTIWATYTASYAKYQEYGAKGKPGRAFVRLAAQQWPTIVAQVTAEAKSRSSET